MDTLYDRNGLVFWTEQEIKQRQIFADYFVGEMRTALRAENRAFEMIQVEAPILMPIEFVNKNYTPADYYWCDDLALRPETTTGSYQYAKWLLAHTETKTRMPICVWQHGKSFRREQDQVTKNMRLKEFYQLEFQCVYGTTTANDYSRSVVPAVLRMIQEMIGSCGVEHSERLPDYSEETLDIVCAATKMEVCSISKRKDFEGAKVLEVAIGTDRCVYNFFRARELHRANLRTTGQDFWDHLEK